MNLTHHSRNVRLILDLIFLKDLYSDLLLCQLVDALSHLTQGARSDRLTYHVVADKAIISSFLASLGRLGTLNVTNL